MKTEKILFGIAGALVVMAVIYSTSGTHVAARDMTYEEAHRELESASNSGDLIIKKKGSRPIDRIMVSSAIAGIPYSYIGGGVDRTNIDNLDPKFAVFLLRLARVLKPYGVVRIHDLGITHGSGSPQDVHNQGRALDLAGVVLDDGNVLNILKDWGNKPTPYPHGAVKTEYRLNPNDKGYEIFKAIYEFATREGSDSSIYMYKNGTPSRIGEHSYVITPDHPSPSLRVAHQNHIHMQVGPTVTTSPYLIS